MNSTVLAVSFACMTGTGAVLCLFFGGLMAETRKNKDASVYRVSKRGLFIGLGLLLDGFFTLLIDAGYGDEYAGAAYWFLMVGFFLLWVAFTWHAFCEPSTVSGHVANSVFLCVSILFLGIAFALGPKTDVVDHSKDVYHIVSQSGDEVATIQGDEIAQISENDGTVTIKLHAPSSQLTFDNCQYTVEGPRENK